VAVFRFPLGLRMVEELLAARGIIVSHETVRQWARKFGQQFANQIRRRLPRVGDKWHLDEVVLKIAGVKHWLWRAVDQTGIVLDVLVQRRRDKQAAKRLLRKLLKKQMRPPRVLITDKLASYGANTITYNPIPYASEFNSALQGINSGDQGIFSPDQGIPRWPRFRFHSDVKPSVRPTRAR
jgi:transposase-like protein